MEPDTFVCLVGHLTFQNCGLMFSHVEMVMALMF